MTDNLTTERVDHPPRVREAIDELMREKDATDNRTTELLPCPFCGGEADEYEGDYGNGIYCMRCGAMVGEPIHLEYMTTKRVSIAEAIAAWNARAERTCRDASVDSSTQFYCSLCECTVDIPLLWGEVNYCPNCGRKVERGDA